jgi:hypothetical protein
VKQEDKYLSFIRKLAFTASGGLRQNLSKTAIKPPGTFIGIYPWQTILSLRKPGQKEGSWVYELIDMPRAIYSYQRKHGV